jgi:hypothetical protein
MRLFVQRLLLKNPSVADEDIIETMSLVMSAESEWANKFTQEKPAGLSTKISKVEAGASGEPKENNTSNQQVNQILATLKATQSELNTVQSGVASLQNKVYDKDYPRNHPPAEGGTRSYTTLRPRSLYPRQCKCVTKTQMDCSHSFKCGGPNHTAR